MLALSLTRRAAPWTVYFELAKLGYRRFASYRGATFAGIFTNTIFGFMLAYVTLALFSARGSINGYDGADAVTYMWIGQGMLMTTYIISPSRMSEIAQRIRSGDIATDLQRPLDFQLYWLAQDLGRGTYHAIFRGVPPFVLGALVFSLRWPTSPLVWLAFVASVMLAVLVSFGMRFLVNLTAAWVLDYRGFASIAGFTWPFLAGNYIPLAALPDWAYHLAILLPTACLIQTPAAVFLGKPDTGQALLLQLGWAVALLGLGRVVLRRAERRLVVQGG